MLKTAVYETKGDETIKQAPLSKNKCLSTNSKHFKV
jgi:hypothetical protein